MTTDTEAGWSAIERLGFFASASRDEITVERLGGLTNLVYKVQCNGAAYVLRVPGKGTAEYINRRVEAVAARAAAKAGVSPEVIVFEDDGTMLASYVYGATTMTPALFKSTAGAPTRAGRAFKQLHASGARFDFRFELFRMIDDYLKVLSTREARLPDGYHDVLKEAEVVRRALAARPLPQAPCHCDPLAENFLDTGARMWIVDWEYSGMNDPLWDLGDLTVEAGLGIVEEEEMLLAYFGGEPKPAERGRVVIYKAMCDLLWTLWGLIQLANKNPADDFWLYATNRFERCKALMARPEFPRHIGAVLKG